MKPLSILLCGLLLSTSQCILSQDANLKWGKPSQVEWSLQAWGEAPDAEAIILCKTVNVTYEITRAFTSYSSAEVGITDAGSSSLGVNNNQCATATYSVKLRTKILKDNGLGYANLDIIYYNSEEEDKERDELGRPKVTVFSLNEKGKQVKRAVKGDQFSETRIDANYVAFHIKVPDVKVGEIIEYQYELSSTRATFLYDCSFQEDIPILYALCDMDIPAFLQFDMKVPRHPFIKSRVEPSAISGPQRGDMKAPDRYPSNHYIIEGHDILPKGLDLQRQHPDVEAAQVQSGNAKLMDTRATYKLSAHSLAPMPKDKKHIVLNP